MSRAVGLGMTARVTHLSTLLTQLKSGLEPYTEPPAVALREIELVEKFDRESVGWIQDAGLGERYAQRTQILYVSQNESLFDKLLRRASWEHWQALSGRDNVSPIHWLNWQGDGTVDTTRVLVDSWQQELFRNGDRNRGFLILRHRDPIFWRRFRIYRTGREPEYQTPTRRERRA